MKTKKQELMLQRLLFLTLLFSVASVQAQFGGQDVYQFLNMPVNPLHSALGGKNITMRDYNPTNAFLNPAHINSSMNRQASVNYMSYASDISYGSAAYAHKVNEKYGILQAGVTFVDYGNFEGYDEMGNRTNDFSGSDAAFSLAYAYRFSDTRFSIGTSLKLITSRLEQYSSFGLATDIGGAFTDEDTGWIVSAAVRNLGAQLASYDEVQESIPLELMLGVSKRLENVPIRWHVTLQNMQQWDLTFRNPARDETDLEGNVTRDDPGVINNIFRHAVFGVELFPEGGFSIRLGYNFMRAEELRILNQRSFAGLSGGFMLKINRMRFSYSYMRFNLAAGTSFFGLDVDLN
ncbi:MAG: type IX secretion system protein PorQ [Bacteroidota bacterium]